MNAIDYAGQASELFVLSDSFLRIKELIDDESSTIDDISEVILIDPALASDILKLANSSFFNYPGKIDTISKAVLVLGITEVYNLVIAFFASNTFKSVSGDSDYLDKFWGNSVNCALLIKFLGSSLNLPNAERFFILGLLHNLGELIVHQVSPEKVSQCESDDVSIESWQKQQEVLGFTYAECGAELFKLWQLPYNLIGPVRNQNEGNFEMINVESQLLYIAKRLMDSNLGFDASTFSPFVSDKQLSTLSLDKSILASAIAYCDLERLSILSILNPSAAMIY